MTKVHWVIAVWAVCCYSISSSDAARLFSDSLPSSIRFYPVNSAEELLNAGPFNLNEAKLIDDSDLDSKSEEEDQSLLSVANDQTQHDQSASEPMTHNVMDDDDDDDADSEENNTIEDSSQVLYAKLNIHPQHIIGYVPLNSAGGQALVFPAGAVRINNNNEIVQLQMHDDESQEVDGNAANDFKMATKEDDAPEEEEEDPEPEERGLRKRKRIRRRNSKQRLRRNRKRHNRNNVRRNSHRKNTRRSNKRYYNRNNSKAGIKRRRSGGRRRYRRRKY